MLFRSFVGDEYTSILSCPAQTLSELQDIGDEFFWIRDFVFVVSIFEEFEMEPPAFKCSYHCSSTIIKHHDNHRHLQMNINEQIIICLS